MRYKRCRWALIVEVTKPQGCLVRSGLELLEFVGASLRVSLYSPQELIFWVEEFLFVRSIIHDWFVDRLGILAVVCVILLNFGRLFVS